jgi:uncharacterized protein (DUF58 family)
VRWQPTHAHVRVLVVAAVLLVIAVVGRRPDAAVLGLPLAFIAVWGRYFRPREEPQVQTELDADVLFEGQATTYRLRVPGTVDPDIDLIVAALPRSRWFDYSPRQAAVAEPVRISADASEDAPDAVALEVGVRAKRWGLRTLERPTVVATSVLGSYRIPVPSLGASSVTTLPLREGFAAVDAMPRPAGLVGLHRSRRPGEGTELAGVRPFRTGDRLRRINWSVSARTRELHVTSTWSDRDTEVVILLDTGGEIGVSEGIDGRSSSLDTGVRAAASIAEHYLRHGDRVRLVDTGNLVRGVRKWARSSAAHPRRTRARGSSWTAARSGPIGTAEPDQVGQSRPGAEPVAPSNDPRLCRDPCALRLHSHRRRHAAARHHLTHRRRRTRQTCLAARLASPPSRTPPRARPPRRPRCPHRPLARLRNPRRSPPRRLPPSLRPEDALMTLLNAAPPAQRLMGPWFQPFLHSSTPLSRTGAS